MKSNIYIIVQVSESDTGQPSWGDALCHANTRGRETETPGMRSDIDRVSLHSEPKIDTEEEERLKRDKKEEKRRRKKGTYVH